MTPSSPSDESTVPSKPSLRAGRSELTREVLRTQVQEDKANEQFEALNGARWFYLVAVFSVINSITTMSGGKYVFLAGLAISRIADAFAARIGFAGPFFSLGIDLVAAVFLCGFGYLTSCGSRAALITGIVLYALDGTIFLYFSEFAPAAMHAFILYLIWQGWETRQKLNRLQNDLANPPAVQPARRGPIS